MTSRHNCFHEVFTKAVALKPSKPFLVVGRDVLTYGELLRKISLLTRVYKNAGLQPGDRVVLATADDTELTTLFLSLLCNGLAAVILDPKAPAPAANNLILAADARGIILDSDLRTSWNPEAAEFILEIHKKPGRSVPLFNKLLRKKSEAALDPTSYPTLLKGLDPANAPDDLSGDLVAMILFTSGTTAQPKGVQLTHDNLAHHLGTLSKQFNYDAQVKILNILPLHHTDGITQGPLVAFWNRGTVFRPVHFSIQNIGVLLDAIYAERITHFIAVPTILSLILKFGQEFHDAFTTEDFRFIVSAAAALEEDLWSSFEDFFAIRVANLYGLTETVTGGLFSGPTEKDHRYGTVGKPVDCQARIVDDEGLGAVTGELQLRGDNIMLGYLNAREATEAVLCDGWLSTGDIATMDDDGFYRIVGRKKNVIITGGLNVHPEEVTEVLNTHQEVLESATFGIYDSIWGEKVVSAVVLNGKLVSDSSVFIGYCRGLLAPAKVPHKIHIVPFLPKGPSGKVVMAKVRELVEHQGRVDVETGGGDFCSRLYAIAASCFNAPVHELNQGTLPDHLPGWDSLAHLQFIVELEEAFQIRLSPREIMRISSLGAAEQIIGEKFQDG